MKTLLEISGWMMIPAIITVILRLNEAHAEEPIQYSGELTPDTSEARIRLQVDYALNVGEETLQFINDYQAQHPCLVPEEIFTAFVDSLLRHGKDPIIQTIKFSEKSVIITQPENGTLISRVPEQLVITMHSDSFVETTLRGQTFNYRFTEGTWLLDFKASTAPIIVSPSLGPPPLPFYYCLGVITNHCQTPIGYQFPRPDFWSDKEWCPEWHKLVRPPQAEDILVDKTADDALLVQAPAADTESAGFIIPPVADFPYCVGVITNHCKIPLGITTLNLGYPAAQIDTWADTQWCPAWHNFVGRPPQ